MARAKILDNVELEFLLNGLNPQRRVLVLLGHGAGLRAQSIATLDWRHVTDASGNLVKSIDLQAVNTKGRRGGGRLPMSDRCFEALNDLWQRQGRPTSGPVVTDSKGRKLSAHAAAQRITRCYERSGLQGCSSHSGRRSFATKLLRNKKLALSDVQVLMRHAKATTTAIYIEPDEDKNLVSAVAGL